MDTEYWKFAFKQDNRRLNHLYHFHYWSLKKNLNKVKHVLPKLCLI